MENGMDLRALWGMAVRRIRMILAVTFAGTLLSTVVTLFLITPKYTSEALLYVENTREAADTVNVNDLNAAQKLVNTCVIIFKNDVVLRDVQSQLGLTYPPEQFKKMIELSSVNGTEVLRVQAESSSALEAQNIVDTLLEIAPKEFERIVKFGSVSLISPASYELKPSSPKLILNIAVGTIVGLILSVLLALVLEVLDVTVRPADDLYGIYGVPVFAEVADFELTKKGGGR